MVARLVQPGLGLGLAFQRADLDDPAARTDRWFRRLDLFRSGRSGCTGAGAAATVRAQAVARAPGRARHRPSRRPAACRGCPGPCRGSARAARDRTLRPCWSSAASTALVTTGCDCGGCGTIWVGPALATFIGPALTCSVFTRTGVIGSVEPGIGASAWADTTPLVSGAMRCCGVRRRRLGRGRRGDRLGGRGGDLHRRDLAARGLPSLSKSLAGGRLQLDGLAFDRLDLGLRRTRLRARRLPAPPRPGRAILGDRSDRALGRAAFQMFGKQVAHDCIARAAGAAAEHDADQMAVAALDRGDEVEAGGAGETGLDAVDALDAAEQLVVIADRLAAIVEAVGREVPVVAREAVLDGAAERGLIARRGDLLGIGQAVRVAIGRAVHAERARLARHQLGELVDVAGDRFGDHHRGVVGRAGDEALDCVLDLHGRLRAGPAWSAPARRRFGDRHHGVELHLAGLEPLEQQVERHDLGERGRKALRVGVVRLQRRAGVGVDDDGGEGRGVDDARVMDALAALALRLGMISGEKGGRHRGDQAKHEQSTSARGRSDCAEHELPVPLIPAAHGTVTSR